MATKPLEQKTFEPIPEGFHQARLIWLIELGTHEDTNYETKELVDKHRFHIGFELLDVLKSDGEPFVVSKRFNVTPSKFGGFWGGANSNIFKFAKQAGIVKEKGVSTSRIAAELGKPFTLLTSNITRENDGRERTFCNIESVKPGKDNFPAFTLPIINFTIDDAIPDNMPEYITKVILESKEKTGAALVTGELPVSSPEPKIDLTDDDIPF